MRRICIHILLFYEPMLNTFKLLYTDRPTFFFKNLSFLNLLNNYPKLLIIIEKKIVYLYYIHIIVRQYIYFILVLNNTVFILTVEGIVLNSNPLQK